MSIYQTPPEPDHDTLWDYKGRTWKRVGDNTWRYQTHALVLDYQWTDLVTEYGPLTNERPLRAGDTITDLTQEHERVPEGSVLHTTRIADALVPNDSPFHVLRAGDAWWYGDGTEMYPTSDIEGLARSPYTVTRIGWPRKGQPLIPAPEADK